MALKWLNTRLMEQPRGEGAGSGGQSRNAARLARMEAISRVADGKRAREMADTDGQRVTGEFSGGEFNDSPEAREVAAEQEEALAQQAIEEQAERQREAERLEQEEAQRLQSEGAGDGEPVRQRREEGEGDAPVLNEAGDERVVGGVKHYLTIVNGQEKWLTLAQLRESAALTSNAQETLQRAEEALQRASQAALTPKEVPVEIPPEGDLTNIILAANMGDEEAARKLAQILRSRPAGGATTQDVSRAVAQQIATQREIDRAEAAASDFLGNQILAPVFKQRLHEFASAKPDTPIATAYQAVGEQMRRDFAAMIKPENRLPQSKADRKRTIVTPPTGAGRQQQRTDEDREVPVSEEIDSIARARGQLRAHRIRRS